MEFRFSDKNPLHPISLFSFDAMHTRIEVLLTGVRDEVLPSELRSVAAIWSVVSIVTMSVAP